MPKSKKTFRLEKGDIEYIQALVKKGYSNNQTQALTSIINYHKEQQGLNVQMPEKFNSFVLSFYNKFTPVFATLLYVYFWIRQSWVFVLFLIVAIIPFAFPINLKDNILKVKV